MIPLVVIGVLISLDQHGSNTVAFSVHSTSLKYSKPGVTDGSRLLLVCDVALGRCRQVYRTDVLLKQAPDGYDSVRGVRRTPNTPSEFEVGLRERLHGDKQNKTHSLTHTNIRPLLCPPG